MMKFRLLFPFLLITLNSIEAAQVSDGEFEAALYRVTSGDAVLKLARTEHPKALEVLRALDSIPKDAWRLTWGEFKSQHNFNYDFGRPDDATITGNLNLSRNKLQAALAIAGDQAAYDRIVSTYLNTETRGEPDDKRWRALNMLGEINDDRAIRTIMKLVYEKDLYIRNVGGASFAAQQLSELVDNSYYKELYEKTTAQGINMNPHEKLDVWKLWWAENAANYGASEEEIAFAKSAIGLVAAPDKIEATVTPDSRSKLVEQPPEPITEEVEDSSQFPILWVLIGGGLILFVGYVFFVRG